MRRVCAYVLERSLGRLIARAGDDGDARGRRFDARASDGVVALEDVELDAEAAAAYAGETLAKAGVTLVSARCGKITGRIPWEAIGRDSCSLELEDVALVVQRRVDGEEEEKTEEEEEDASGDARSSMIVRRVLSALARGLRGRAREVTVVVQDASGVGKFLARVASFEYTHGAGATFEGLSARKISTGVGCSTSELIVGDVRGTMEVSSDFTRVDVALEDVVASASMATTTTLAEFFERRRGELARESRVKTATSSTPPPPRRSFIRDVLLSSSDLASSVYEEATESMEGSAYEDAEEFFDADEAIRELGRSMDFSSASDDDVETTRGGFVCVVRCPNITVDVPFDESVTRATMTNARVVVDERATVSFDDATCTYGYDETHTVQLRARGGEATTRDDRVAVRVDGLVVAVDGVERATLDGGVDAEAFFLEDAGRPLDGSLPNACVAEIEAVTSSLRERLANDANVYVKASAPSVTVVVNADAVDAVVDVAASAYELPERHPFALRPVTPDSVLNPLVIALDVDRVDVELTRSTREEEEEEARVTLGIERASAFAATNVAGDLGSDFVWMRFEDARACVDGVDIASVRGVDGRDASTLAFARAAGERSRADARVVGAAVSATECEPLVRRLNTFLSVPDDGDGDDDDGDNSGGVDVTACVVDAALVYKSNGSFGVLSADFLRVSSADARASDDVVDDARDLSTDRGVEMHCGDIVGFIAPPHVDDVGGLRRLRAFPFARQSLRAARFAPAFRAEAVSLHTMSSRARTAIATVCAETCAVSLHVDTLRALRRLSATDIDAFVSDDDEENDENEYVFVSPVKKPRDVSRASYGSNVTRSVIEDATRDHELFPKPVRGERNAHGERRRSTPLRDRGGGPNVIENFFYRDTRRARRGARRAPMFASGSVTSARRRRSTRARVRGLDASMMPRRRFAGDFVESPPPPPPVAARRSIARRRYLPLPADAVVPRSTIHVNTDAVEISILPGSYWSETPAGVPRHADSVARDPSGSSAGVSLSFRTNAVRVDTFPTESSEVAHRLAVSAREVSCVDTTPGATWPNVAKRAAGAGEETDACALDVAAVRPDPNVPEELEYTVRASMVPLHVKLDQRVLKLITDVFASDEASTARVPPPPSADATYFQKIEIARTSLRLDYCGRQVDVESLRSGNLLEALNLIPWDGVSLDVQPLRLVGVLGVAAAARSILQSWLDDVTHTQAHKFVQGVKPIKSAVDIGRRAADVVSKPLEYHRDKRRGGVVAGFALGVASFVREVSLSSVELGAFAANKSAVLLAAAEAMIAEHTERAETETETENNAAAADPADVFQGLSLARRAAFSGARRAATAVVIDPIRDYAAGHASSSDAISRAVRRVPFAAVTGAKGCARAVDAALSGAAKSLRADSAADAVDSESTVVARRHPA